MKTRTIGIILTLCTISVAYAAAQYKVTMGVKPGCHTGATLETTVTADSEIEACSLAMDQRFPFCCKAIKK